MLTIVLFVFFIVMLVIAYFLFKKDIGQPAIIFFASYTLSMFCACLNINKWSMDLGWQSFFTLLGGAIEFLTISYILMKFFEKKYRKKMDVEKKREIVQNKDFYKDGLINVEKWKVFLVIIYDVVILICLIIAVLDIASKFGDYSNYSQALTIFRENTSYNNNITMPRILTLAQKPMLAAVYIMLYVFIHNLVLEDKKLVIKLKNNMIYLIPVILGTLSFLVQSNRGSVLKVIVAGVMISIVLMNKKKNYINTFSLKNIGTIVVIGVAVLILFYAAASLIGRKTKYNFIEYITMYAGGSIRNLDMYYKEPLNKDSTYIGIETFHDLINNLGKIGILDVKNMPTNHLEFRFVETDHGKLNTGNVYTAYRRWMQDFGIEGMIVLQAIMCVAFNFAYNKIKYSNKTNKSTLGIIIIIYGLLSYTLFMHPIDGIFYNTIFRSAAITQTIVTIIGYYILITDTKNIVLDCKNVFYKLKNNSKRKENGNERG